MNNLDGASLDVERMEREKLRAVFPECFAEGKLNVKKLLALCGEYDDNDFEKYKFEWKGKDASLRLAQQRSMATLRPCRAESVAWDTTQNLYLEGDNLEVLKLLQTAYYRRVKMIYIDPPYNTGNDFVYEDDFADPIQKYKEVTSQTTRSNPETMGRFHTNWLNMMYPRLRLAANLLRDDGVIFISIDDHEVHNLRKLCDEVFGEENFVAQIIWERAFAPVNLKKHFSESHDYVVCYAKQFEKLVCNGLRRNEKSDDRYSNPDDDPRGVWTSSDMTVGPVVPEKVYEIITPSGKSLFPTNGRCWLFTKDRFEEMLKDNRIWFGNDGSNTPRVKKFLTEVKAGITPMTVWKYTDVGHSQDAQQKLKALFGGKAYFDYPKPVELIKRMIELYTTKDTNDIILDFFSGSATTAHAVMQLNKDDGGNRRFIMVQLPELTDEKSEAYKAGYKNICEIGKERIRRAGRVISEKKVISDQWLVDSEKKVVSGKKVISGQWLVDSENTGVSGQGLGESEKTGDLFADEKLTTNHCPLTTKETTNHYSLITNHSNHLPLTTTNPDTGFRVFKLDTSNLRTWDATPVDSDDPQQMELLLDRMHSMVETIKSDRSDEDVVYELMLKMGVPPTYSVTPVEIDGKRAYCIGEECLLLVCLQEGLTAATIERMAEEWMPSKMLVSEKCFADDTAIANAHYILRDRGIELKLV